LFFPDEVAYADLLYLQSFGHELFGDVRRAFERVLVEAFEVADILSCSDRRTLQGDKIDVPRGTGEFLAVLDTILGHISLVTREILSEQGRWREPAFGHRIL
jgi:hypothetical protein